MLDAYIRYSQFTSMVIAVAYALYAHFRLPPDWFWWPLSAAVILYTALRYGRAEGMSKLLAVLLGIMFATVACVVDSDTWPGMSMTIASAVSTIVLVGVNKRFDRMTVRQRLYKCVAFFPVIGIFAPLAGIGFPLWAAAAISVALVFGQRWMLYHAREWRTFADVRT
jgi:hypothetical protein